MPCPKQTKLNNRGCDDQGTLAVSGTFWGPPPPTVTLTCDPTALMDADGNVSTCTITSDQPAPEGGLPVALTPPADNERYTTTCASPLTIAEGGTTVTCTITAVANTVVGDGSVTATLAIAESEAYALGDPASADVVINDDDQAGPVITTPTPVPTLSEWALMLLGLGIAGLAARRRLR